MAVLRARSTASRILALGLLAALVGCIWLGTVDPIRTRYQENDEALANGSQLLSHLRSAVADERRTSANDDAAQLERYRGDFLAGTEDAIVAADLQTRLSALIAARAAEVVSARALQPKPLDDLVYIGLRLSVRGDMRNLQEVIYAIETMTPLMFLERAALRPDDRAAGARDPGAASLAPMTMEIDVYGAKWPGLTPVSGSGRTR